LELRPKRDKNCAADDDIAATSSSSPQPSEACLLDPFDLLHLEEGKKPFRHGSKATVAGMPTRFKYRTVERNDYGLMPEEILFTRDSTLKSYVSLKKMTLYHEDVSMTRDL